MSHLNILSNCLSIFTFNSTNTSLMAEDFVDSILRCGLYLGAIFQLVFIAAAVIIPDKIPDLGSSNSKELEASDDEGSDHSSPQATPRRPHVHHTNRRKMEKKKRR